MNNFDETLKKALSNQGYLDPERSSALQQEVIQMYDKKLRIVTYITWGFHVFFGVILLLAAFQMYNSTGVKFVVQGGVIFLTAISGLVVIKLWYWVMNAKISMLKEMKQMQLQIAELASKDNKGDA